MNLHSDYPYWLVNEGVLTDYPRLQGDTETGALIIGGGISGALIGHELAKRDIASIIVDKRHIGFGSTSSRLRCSSTRSTIRCTGSPGKSVRGQVGSETTFHGRTRR